LVDKLGYRRFAVHGGDWGGMVAEHMGRSHAASLIGLHLTDVPFFHMFREPSDPSRFSRDEILTHIMIYWATQTIDSSFFPYYDMANAGAVRWISEMVKGWLGSADVPAGFALFPKDLVTPPREWAERFFNVRRWTEMPRGGHFAAMEEPALLAQDLRATFAPLWEAEHPRGAHTAPAAMSAVP
jgi:pimeloyl-ACP methyl ester carboxylesterase